MEFRNLGRDGPRVPALTFGTGTFGGVGRMFRAWGTTDAAEARRLVDICLEAGVDLFDTADNYSDGQAEAVLGEAVAHRRGDVRIATKTTLPFAEDQAGGSSRARLHRAVDASLRRLGVERIELLQLHARARIRRLRRRWVRSTNSSAPARWHTSASPTSRAGS